MQKTGVLLVVVTCVTGLLLFGCVTKPAPAPEAPPQVLKIGSVWPLTGPGAGWGLPFRNVMQYQADKINSQGGITIGGQKYTLEIIHEDSKYVATEARKATEKLVYQDKVKYILGPLGGGELAAMAPILTENKVINAVVVNAIDCVGPDKPYCFRPFMGVGEQIYAFMKFFKDKYNIKTTQVIMDDTESGRSAVVDIQIACDMLGIKLLEVEYFPRDIKDFYPIMSKVLPRNPDLIQCGGAPGVQGLQLKVLKEMGYKGLKATSTPTTVGALLQAADKEAIEGYFTVADIVEGPLANPLLVKWKAEWEASGRSWADAGGAVPANYLPLILQGMQEAGTVSDTDKVKVAMEKMTFNSPVYGPCPWGGMERYGINHVLIYPMGICQIRDGKEVGIAVIQPKDMKVIARPKK